MDIFDLHDGTTKPPHVMWETLKRRAALGRNDWHERASQFTRRVLSPANNLSAVLKGNRKMPLHDIVPMLSAFELPPDQHNHYVREFLKSYLPVELVDFFHAPDDSTEALLLREANINFQYSLNAVRSEMANNAVLEKVRGNSEYDYVFKCPNELTNFCTGEAEKAFEYRRRNWVHISIRYLELSAQKNKSALRFLNEYYNMLLPLNWRDKLYTEINNDVLTLIKYDAPTTQMTWIENCLHPRPLRSILPVLFDKWQLKHKNSAEKYIASWRSIPDEVISRHHADEFRVKHYEHEYFVKHAWISHEECIEEKYVTFERFIEDYIIELIESHHSIDESMHPLNDLYGTLYYKLMLIGEYRHYEKVAASTNLTFEEFCSFGTPKAKKNKTILRDMTEMILQGLLQLQETSLLDPLISSGCEKKDITYLYSALSKASKTKKYIAVLKIDGDFKEYRTLERLILMLPKTVQAKYRKRVRECINHITLHFSELNASVTDATFNALATDIISENIDVYLSAIAEHKSLAEELTMHDIPL